MNEPITRSENRHVPEGFTEFDLDLMVQAGAKHLLLHNDLEIARFGVAVKITLRPHAAPVVSDRCTSCSKVMGDLHATSCRFVAPGALPHFVADYECLPQPPAAARSDRAGVKVRHIPISHLLHMGVKEIHLSAHQQHTFVSTAGGMSHLKLQWVNAIPSNRVMSLDISYLMGRGVTHVVVSPDQQEVYSGSQFVLTQLQDEMPAEKASEADGIIYIGDREIHVHIPETHQLAIFGDKMAITRADRSPDLLATSEQLLTSKQQTAQEFISSFVLGQIREERLRQIQVEKQTPQHDDAEHPNGELARAAAVYAMTAVDSITGVEVTFDNDFNSALWPWEKEAFKPKDARRDLIRAAALILAQIEQLDRLDARASRAVKS